MAVDYPFTGVEHSRRMVLLGRPSASPYFSPGMTDPLNFL